MSTDKVQVCDQGSLHAEVEELRRANRQLQEQLEEERRLRREQLEENERLASELQLASAASGSGSEGRLRAALASGAGTGQLAQAISGVEALLDEARRELSAKRLRERRAAFELLHQAMSDSNEGPLLEALEAARQAELDQDELEKGESRLRELQSMTEEQKAAIVARAQESEQKKQAYLLVKKDQADELLALISGLGEEVRWQEWRDYQGRSLMRCAKDLRSARAQQAIQGLLPEADAPAGGSRPSRFAWSRPNESQRTSRPTRQRPAPSDAEEAEERRAARKGSGEGGPQHFAFEAEHAPAAAASSSSNGVNIPVAVHNAPPLQGVADAASGLGVPIEHSPTSPEPNASEMSPIAAEEEERLKRKSFRAVVQDDTDSLVEVLDAASPEVLSRWHNKAGKSLLTLSEERGSPGVYAILAKAYGLLQEQKREAFEESQTVWVYLQGEVQPRRATVLEDTPAEADDVLVEFWEGNSPPEKVDRSMVLRMWT